MVLAELEVFHSRPYAPTRRVALGRCHLPVEPAPGPGAILLGATMAVAADEIDPELRPDLHRLTAQLEVGDRVVQPRCRHRFQADHHGLARTRGVLRGRGERLDFDFDGVATPLQMALAAVYAAGRVTAAARPRVFEVLWRGMGWHGPIGPDLVAHLSGPTGVEGWAFTPIVDPRLWALDLFEFDTGHEDADDDRRRPSKREIQRRFRQLLRAAHPDHGAETAGAAQRIADLTAARRILLDR